MTYEQAIQPATWYHTQGTVGEGEQEDESLSRGSTASATHLVSPLNDLTETVNTNSIGYAPIPFDEPDWPVYPSMPSSTLAPVWLNGYQDHPNNQGNAATGSDKGLGAEGAGGCDGSAFGLPQYDIFNGVHIDSKSFTQTPNPTDGSPFAHMPTHLLQQYLINAGALQQYQASCGLGLPQAGPSTGTSRTLFQSPGAIDMNTLSGSRVERTRSPSPLVEMSDHDEDTAGDELLDHVESSLSPGSHSQRQQRPSRRASDDCAAGPATRKASTRRMSAHLPMEEKLLRAQATEGLSKHDKRRMQNKLAQRAFRARSKVANRHVFSRLEHLEELTEQQADRIVKMTELVGRLQKENTGLKTAKFEAAMQAAAPQQQQQQQPL